MPVSNHALLSPSSASRWLACTPSARLEEQFPDSSSEAAKEGTAAHALGELLIKYKLKQIRKPKFQTALNLIEKTPYYNTEMWGYCDDYSAFVIERLNEAKAATPDAIFFLEQRLDMTDYVQDGFGTGDAVIIADGTMDMIDLKYGKGVPVSAEENKQMMLYALGALKDYDLLYDVRTVRMTIYQPRLNSISTWEMPRKELFDWAETVLKPRAAMAYSGEGEYAAGDHCRFCKAKAVCKAHAEENLKLAQYDFQEGELLTDAEITDILNRADRFKKWLSAVEEHALNEAVNNGKKWPEYKLVEGRSVRQYSNKDEAAKTLLDNGYSEEKIFTKSLLGITAMEKEIGKKEFTDLLNPFVIKPEGKPALVHESDKRPEYHSASAAAKDFEIPV